MLGFWDFQMKLQRKETSYCCQVKCIEKKVTRKTGWSQHTWRGFPGTPKEKKVYVVDSYKKTCETLYYSLEKSFFS